MELPCSLADLLLAFSLGLNLLCLYCLCARAPESRRPPRRQEPRVTSGGREAAAQLPAPPSARPGKQRPDMEAERHSQWADSEGFSEEQQDSNTYDSEEAEEEEENKPLQLTEPESSLKGAQAQSITEASCHYQSTSTEEDYLPFLKEFPAQKEEIEKCICCLRETAEAIYKTHKDCTIANITASSAGLTSGVLTILGLTLTPFTAGASLILTATGLGLGAAAATTGVSAHISERVINSKHSKRSQALIETCEESLNKCKRSLATLFDLNEIDLDSWSHSDGKQPIGEKQHPVLGSGNVAQLIPKAINTVKGIRTNVQALELARANPALKVLAKQATAAGRATRASLKGVEQVETAFKGTALAMSKGTRVMGAVTVGLFILYDTFSLVQDAIHLAKGAKEEKATQIREEASKLEEALQNLSELHDQLKEYHRLQSYTHFPGSKPR
ncbi:apolipoprotein L2-like [Tiliqua scincoides]|uniref:apolipoprotein L2-like n=1 Tax=Tiliqua scincoides TaxID=71010 RepID=UPI0034619183